MDYRSMQRSPWGRVATLFIFLGCTLIGAVDSNPFLVVFGLLGLGLQAFNLTHREGLVEPRNPAEAALRLSEGRVRYLVTAACLVIAFVVSGGLFYRAGRHADDRAAEVFGGVLVALALLTVVLVALVVRRVRRELRTRTDET